MTRGAWCAQRIDSPIGQDDLISINCPSCAYIHFVVCSLVGCSYSSCIVLQLTPAWARAEFVRWINIISVTVKNTKKNIKITRIYKKAFVGVDTSVNHYETPGPQLVLTSSSSSSSTCMSPSFALVVDSCSSK